MHKATSTQNVECSAVLHWWKSIARSWTNCEWWRCVDHPVDSAIQLIVVCVCGYLLALCTVIWSICLSLGALPWTACFMQTRGCTIKSSCNQPVKLVPFEFSRKDVHTKVSLDGWPLARIRWDDGFCWDDKWTGDWILSCLNEYLQAVLRLHPRHRAEVAQANLIGLDLWARVSAGTFHKL